MEARYIKEQLETILGGAEVFLDFDNLRDLKALLQHVRDSDVFLVLLTADLMSRPWCILELHAAVSARIPMRCCVHRGQSGVQALCPERQAPNVVWLHRRYFCTTEAPSVQQKLLLFNRSYFCLTTEGVLGPSPRVLKNRATTPASSRAKGTIVQTGSIGTQHLRIPIVAVTLRGKEYDHEKTKQHLMFLDTELERLNPGALQVLRENALDPEDAHPEFSVPRSAGHRRQEITPPRKTPNCARQSTVKNALLLHAQLMFGIVSTESNPPAQPLLAKLCTKDPPPKRRKPKRGCQDSR